jgi:TP901 family phage tail tape measure protein
MAQGIKIPLDASEALREMNKFKKSLKDTGLETKLTGEQVKKLEKKFKNKMEADKASKEMAKLAKSVGMTNKEFKELGRTVGLSKKQMKDASSHLAKANQQFISMEFLAKRARSAIAGFIAVYAFRELIQGLAGVTKEIYEVGSSFEYQMAIVKGVTRATTAEFKELTEAAKLMGATTEWTATQAAEALRFLGMAGLSAKEAIIALEGTINLATAGNLNLAEAADFATNILSGMSMGVEELGRVNDVLVGTITRSNTNIKELAQAMKFVAPVASKMGYAIEEASAFLGILANNGLKAGIAGRNLTQALLRTPKIIEELGIEGSTFTDVLKHMKEESWSARDVMEEFGLVSTKAALALLNSVPAYERFVKTLKKSKGEATELAEIMRNTVQGSMKELDSTIESIKIEIFEEYKDEIKLAIKDTTEWLREHKNELKAVAFAIKDIAVAVISLIGFMAELVSLLGKVTGLAALLKSTGRSEEERNREELIQLIEARQRLMEDHAEDPSNKKYLRELKLYNDSIDNLATKLNGLTAAEMQNLNVKEDLNKELEKSQKFLAEAYTTGRGKTLLPDLSDFDKEIAFMNESLEAYEEFEKTKEDKLFTAKEKELKALEEHYERTKFYYDQDIVMYTAYLEEKARLEEEILQEKFDALDPKTREAIEKGVKDLEREREGYIGELPEMGEEYIKFVQAIEKLITLPERMVQATTSLLNTIAKLGANFKKALLDFEEALENALSNASEILTKGVVQIFRTIGKLPKILADGAKEFTRELANSIPILLEEFVKGAKEFMNSLKDELPGLIEHAAKNMAKAVYNAILAQFGVSRDSGGYEQADANTKEAIRDVLEQQKSTSGQSLPELLEEFNRLEKERIDLDVSSATYYEDSLEILERQFEVLEQIEAKQEENIRALKEALAGVQNSLGILSGSKYSLALAPDELARQTALYSEMQAAAATGDPEAIKAFSEFAVTYLDNFQDMYKSSITYQNEYLKVMEDLRAIEIIAQAKIEAAEKALKEWRDGLLLAAQELYNTASGQGESDGIKVEGINVMQEVLDLILEAVGKIAEETINRIVKETLQVSLVGGGADTGIPAVDTAVDYVTGIISDPTDPDSYNPFSTGTSQNPQNILGAGIESPKPAVPITGNGQNSAEMIEKLTETNSLLFAILEKETDIQVDFDSLDNRIRSKSADTYVKMKKSNLDRNIF